MQVLTAPCPEDTDKFPVIQTPITEPPTPCTVPISFPGGNAFKLVVKCLYQFLHEYEEPPVSAHLSPRRYVEYVDIVKIPKHYSHHGLRCFVIPIELDSDLEGKDNTVLFVI